MVIRNVQFLNIIMNVLNLALTFRQNKLCEFIVEIEWDKKVPLIFEDQETMLVMQQAMLLLVTSFLPCVHHQLSGPNIK